MAAGREGNVSSTNHHDDLRRRALHTFCGVLLAVSKVVECATPANAIGDKGVRFENEIVPRTLIERRICFSVSVESIFHGHFFAPFIVFCALSSSFLVFFCCCDQFDHCYPKMSVINVELHHLYAVLISAALSVRGYRKQSLSWSGAVVAFGAGTCIASCGAASCAALFTFYITGSYLSKRGAEMKAKIELGYSSAGARRSAWQVLCNAGPAVLICTSTLLLHRCTYPEKRWFLAVVAQLSAMQGDTWSSEIGVLSKTNPRLLMGLREVPRGTNGAVSLLGFGAAAASGVVSGLVTAAFVKTFPGGAAGSTALEVFTVSFLSAVGGSILDSLIGQFFQKSVQIASGHMVDGFEQHAIATDGNKHEKKKTPATVPAVMVVSGWNVLSNNGVNAVTGWAVCAAVLSWF